MQTSMDGTTNLPIRRWPVYLLSCSHTLTPKHSHTHTPVDSERNHNIRWLPKLVLINVMRPVSFQSNVWTSKQLRVKCTSFHSLHLQRGKCIQWCSPWTHWPAVRFTAGRALQANISAGFLFFFQKGQFLYIKRDAQKMLALFASTFICE